MPFYRTKIPLWFIAAFLSFSVYVHAQVVFPVAMDTSLDSDTRISPIVFHSYKAPVLQMGIISYGKILAFMGGTVIYKSTSALEMRTPENLRVMYAGVYGTVSVGEKVKAGDTVAETSGRNESTWFVRIYDEKSQQWVDPLSIAPAAVNISNFRVRLIDFEFWYPIASNGDTAGKSEHEEVIPSPSETVNTTGSVYEKRVIQRRMPVGFPRIRVTVDIRDERSKHAILPHYLTITIAGTKTEFTQTQLQAIDNDVDSDEVRIQNERAYILLPPFELSRGYHNASIVARGPFGIRKEFTFSFLSR